MSTTATLSPALPDDLGRVAETVLKAACARDLKLATAESCTRGLIASLLTGVKGASHAFEPGFVTYGARSKCELLGLASEAIERCRAVSQNVAVGMAQGALAGSKADIAVALTGYAGRPPKVELVGHAQLTRVRRGREPAHRDLRLGDTGRGPIRLGAVRAVLEMLQETRA